MRKGSITIEGIVVIMLVLFVLVFIFNTAISLYQNTIEYSYIKMKEDKEKIKAGVNIGGRIISNKSYVRGLDALDDITDQFTITNDLKRAYDSKVTDIIKLFKPR